MRRSEEEFKAAVFERSREYRARQKKRRKAAIGVCLPVLVLAVVSSAAIINFQPQFRMSSANNALTEQIEDFEDPASVGDTNIASADCSDINNGAVVTEIETFDEEYKLIEIGPYTKYFSDSKRFTDSGTISKIICIIEQLESSKTCIDKIDSSGEEVTIVATKSGGDLITFTILNGEYLKTESGEWVSVDTRKTKELFSLIASLPSDKME